jgi:branched-chain amino acid transport system permease protein
VGLFGVSAALAGLAGWLFSFLGVVSPGQFDWSVSLNILVMVLVGGINTTLGPILGAIFVTMFPAVVNIDPWIQEILYGALSICAITLFPEGVVGLVKRRLGARFKPVVSEPAGGQYPDQGPARRRPGSERPRQARPAAHLPGGAARPRAADQPQCNGRSL